MDNHNNNGSNCGHEGCHMNHNQEDKDNKGWEHKCEGGCMMCSMHGCHKHKFLRMIILVAIICFTFWIGRQVGEFKGEYNNRSYDQDSYGMQYRMGMYDRERIGKNSNTMPCMKADAVSGTTATGQTWQQNMMKQAN